MERTLGYYLDICQTIFGTDSNSAKFLQERIKTSPNGREEKVVAAESQILFLVSNLESPTSAKS